MVKKSNLETALRLLTLCVEPDEFGTVASIEDLEADYVRWLDFRRGCASVSSVKLRSE